MDGRRRLGDRLAGRTLTSRHRRARHGRRLPRRQPSAARTADAIPADPAAIHVPVLLQEVLDGLAVRPGGRYVDGTLGLGGHAEAILLASAPDGHLLGIDQDPDARALAAQRLAAFGDRATIVAGNNRRIAALAEAAGFAPADGVLLDLGVSSLQFGPEGRGF